MGHADYGSYLLREAERHEDDAAARAADRDRFISVEANDIAQRLTDGRHDTLVDPYRAVAAGRKLVPLSEEFVEWVNEAHNETAIEVLSGVIFRRQGRFDRVIRDFAVDYAEWQADHTDLEN